jgi:hypothetical protein
MPNPLKLIALPVMAPLGGLTWLARQIANSAMNEWLDPARIERGLFQLERRLDAGEIDEATFEAEEAVLLEELRTIREAQAEEPEE